MQQNNNSLIPVPASHLLQKCKCHEDLVNICREIGKFIFYNALNIGFYFPNETGFDGKFFLQWGSGVKKVRNTQLSFIVIRTW